MGKFRSSGLSFLTGKMDGWTKPSLRTQVVGTSDLVSEERQLCWAPHVLLGDSLCLLARAMGTCLPRMG